MHANAHVNPFMSHACLHVQCYSNWQHVHVHVYVAACMMYGHSSHMEWVVIPHVPPSVFTRVATTVVWFSCDPFLLSTRCTCPPTTGFWKVYILYWGFIVPLRAEGMCQLPRISRVVEGKEGARRNRERSGLPLFAGYRICVKGSAL